MARVLVYERPLEAVFTNVVLGTQPNLSFNETTQTEKSIKAVSHDINKSATSISSETNKSTPCTASISSETNTSTQCTASVGSETNTSTLCTAPITLETNKRKRTLCTGVIDDHRNKLRKSNTKVVKPKLLTCNVCSVQFGSEPALRLHKTVWTSKYICNHCNTRYCTQAGLNAHRRRSCFIKQKAHTPIYYCNHCNNQTRRKRCLQSHMFHVHGDLMRSDKTIIGETTQTSRNSPNSLNVRRKRQLNSSDNNNSNQLNTSGEIRISMTTPHLKVFKLMTERPANTSCTSTERLINSSPRSSTNISPKKLRSSPKTSPNRLHSSTSKTSQISMDSSSETSVTSLNGLTTSSLTDLDTSLKTSPKRLHSSTSKISEISMDSSSETSVTSLNSLTTTSLKDLDTSPKTSPKRLHRSTSKISQISMDSSSETCVSSLNSLITTSLKNLDNSPKKLLKRLHSSTSKTRLISLNSSSETSQTSLTNSTITSLESSANSSVSSLESLDDSSITSLDSLDSSPKKFLKSLYSSPKSSLKGLDNSLKTSMKSLDSSHKTCPTGFNTSSKTSLKSFDSLLETSMKSLPEIPLKRIDSLPETSSKRLDRSFEASLKILNIPYKTSPKNLNGLHDSPPETRNDSVASKRMKQLSMDCFVKISRVQQIMGVPSSLSVTQNSISNVEKNRTSTNVDLKNKTSKTSQKSELRQDTRDLPIHVRPTVIVPLIEKGTRTEFTDPIDSANSIDAPQVSYNLRPSRSPSYFTFSMHELKLLDDTTSDTTQESCEKLTKDSSRKSEAAEALPRTHEERILLEKEQCKECVVLLERIDLKMNNIKLNKNSTAQVATSYTIYKSRICNARYKSMDMLVSHYVARHIPFSYTYCCVCFKIFNSSKALRRHLVVHCFKATTLKRKTLSTNVEADCIGCMKRHECKGCHKQFWLQSCLEQHEKVCRRTNEHRDSVNIATSSRSENFETEEALISDAKSNSATLLENGGQSSETEDSDTSAKTTICSLSTRKRRTPTERRSSSVLAAKDNEIGKTNQKMTYPCVVCGIKFKTFANLSEHEDLYFTVTNKACHICKIAFPTKDLLQLHIKSTHISKRRARYTCFCRFCHQGFSNMKNFWIHVQHIHPAHASYTTCDVCNLVFESHSRFIMHKMYYYKGQTFECAVCGEPLQGLYQLHRHVQLAHHHVIQQSLYIHKCNICNESFQYDSHLHAHKLHVHSDASNSITIRDYALCKEENTFFAIPEDSARVLVKAYGCTVCDLYFVNEMDLRKHQIEYSNNGDFLCDMCNRRYYTFALLANHYCLNHTELNGENVVKCDRCDEVLLTNTSEQCHEKHFHGRGALNDAFKGFDSASNSKFQNGDGNVCTTCGEKFYSMVNLKNHLLEYSDIGPYGCGHCKRRFTQPCYLEEHKMKHSTLDNSLATDYCPICNEGFTDPENVRAHVLHLHRFDAFGSNQNALLMSDSYKLAENAEQTLNNTVPAVRSSLSSNGSSDGKTELRCPKCKIEFNINETMRYRSRFKNSAHLKCPDCGYIFSQFPSRKCNHCTFRFYSSAALYQHVIDKHIDDDDTSKERSDSMTFYYLCKVCDIRYANAREFLAHDMRKHRNGRRQQWPSAVTMLRALQINMDVCCGICGKMFQNTKCFKNHCKVFHATDKQSQCSSEQNVKRTEIVWKNYEPDSGTSPKIVRNVRKRKVKKFTKMRNM